MPTRQADAPLIVTALLDDASFNYLNSLRCRHFPARLNIVPAHVSLFHALPGAEIDDVIETIEAVCRETKDFDLLPVRPILLGRGVAFRYQSADLSRLHALFARAWVEWLTPQDRQAFRAHVTIQNKVEPAEARALFDTIDVTDIPNCRVEGIAVWRYLDGPWEPVATCRFLNRAR